MVTKDFPISPQFSPYDFYRGANLALLHPSSTNGRILLTHVLTLSATEAKIKMLILFRIELAPCAGSAEHDDGGGVHGDARVSVPGVGGCKRDGFSACGRDRGVVRPPDEEAVEGRVGNPGGQQRCRQRDG